MKRAIATAVLTTVPMLLAGCGGGGPNCAETAVLSAGPATAAADSRAAAPGNQAQFVASTTFKAVDAKAECAVPALAMRVNATWTNPDPVHIAVSCAADQTNGLAVCKGPTAGAVTLTATTGTGSAALTAAVQLTCR